MNFDAIHKRPIFIMSAPRVGSTALANAIEKNFRNTGIKLYNEFTLLDPTSPYPYVNEIDYVLNEEKTIPLSKLISNKNFVLKIHLQDFIEFFPDIFKKLIKSKNAFVIRLRRKDFAAQLTSYYIETQRNVWGYNKYNASKHINSTCELSHSKITKIIPFVKMYNEVLNKVNYSYDLDIFYEDLDIMETEYSLKTPKPTNYDEIYTYIQDHLAHNDYAFNNKESRKLEKYLNME